MTMRALKLPADLLPLADMLVQTFQYPENPEWSIQADEEEDISREIKSIRRLWPLFRVAQWVSKPMRDIIRGFLWEEDGQIGGVVIAQRRGSTSTWTIGTVGVLPDFRRRGLARELLSRTLDGIRERGGTHVVLGVIDKNVPAYSLYKSLGFEHYASQLEFHLTPEDVVSAQGCPADYTERELKRFDWEPRYDLAARITPEEVTRYEPMEIGRFKSPAVIKLIIPLISKIQRRVERRFVFESAGAVVGHNGYRTIPGKKGTSSIWAQLDPAHPELAPYMVASTLNAAVKLSPELRVQLSTASWMPALGQTAEEFGFTKRLEYHLLGLIL